MLKLFFFCHFVMLCYTISQFKSSSLYFLMWSFSFIVLSVIRSLLALTPSTAALPQASAVRVICISAHLLSKSLSFYLFFFIPPCFLPFTLPLCFCNLERCCNLLWMFLFIYIYDEFMCLEYTCHIFCWCIGSVWMC